jgi:hypothetical protein
MNSKPFDEVAAERAPLETHVAGLGASGIVSHSLHGSADRNFWEVVAASIVRCAGGRGAEVST